MKCFTSTLSLCANVPRCISHVVVLLKGKPTSSSTPHYDSHHNNNNNHHLSTFACLHLNNNHSQNPPSPSTATTTTTTNPCDPVINPPDTPNSLPPPPPTTTGPDHTPLDCKCSAEFHALISDPANEPSCCRVSHTQPDSIPHSSSSSSLLSQAQPQPVDVTDTAPIHSEMMAEAAVDLVFGFEPGAGGAAKEELESPSSSSMHRIQSESKIQGATMVEEGDGRRRDPYKTLERSQSDASLLRNALQPEEEGALSGMLAADSSCNVSECSRVYLDLSRAEPFERVEFADSTASMFRSSSGRQLETIPQDEELKTGDLSHLYACRRSYSNDSSTSTSLEDVSGVSKVKVKDMKHAKTMPGGGGCASGSGGGGGGGGKSSQEMMKTKTNLKSSIQIYSHTLKQKVRTLQMGSVPEQVNALWELNVLMEQAWSMPVYGKDLAYSLCDILRTERALDIIVNNLTSANRDLLKASARLLEQSLTTHNRKQIADWGLEAVVKMTCDYQGDVELASSTTGILESLFKTSEETCSRVIKLGGLDAIIYWCRCNDRVTLKHCAIALSNLALYGGPDNQQEMTKHKAPEWLFPLAFVDDDSIRYYACLAIAVLVSNKEIEACVLKSGTLSLVLPFIDAHDPQEFAVMDMSHQHGRSSGWLRRLVPVLSSKREEAQALAAFHMAMEAGIKAEQDRKEILYDIEAVDTLKWLASTPNSTASRLAGQALRILGEEVPHKLSQQVPLWTTEDVIQWVSQVGFGDYKEGFQACQVDGDLLLRLTEPELLDSIDMGCAITRKRFLRELRDLKISADYTSCDPTKLGDWLVEVGPEFAQYTYQMIQAGVDKQTLRTLSQEHLSGDCNIGNGIHRMKILGKIEELRSVVSSPSAARVDYLDGEVNKNVKKAIDVFISYRRSNGSQLASLLKVHLQLRGFTVFIDIERLRAGKFDESLLESVRQAHSFIIVLTPNALDRCIGDDERKDWVHKEIVAAMESGLNIIPLTDNFHWPPAEKLPADMKNLPFFNGVRWIHDYQDACVDKLESFLRGESSDSLRGNPLSTSSFGSGDPLSPPQTSVPPGPPNSCLHSCPALGVDKRLFEGPTFSPCCATET
ncbi:LOW QUALITY PROTEIN: NAD(+) hydrolase SARM1-like [Babylonia areolata]|uniref:LOW QUALITY PROTEIN: NAD(+) hydrolase SARM1-like n=1 Tax=Babylonia areolata TaxID=304850 RepID=UPI003FD45AA5